MARATSGDIEIEYEVQSFYDDDPPLVLMCADKSTITNNHGGSWYVTYPQISNHPETPFKVTDSIIE